MCICLCIHSLIRIVHTTTHRDQIHNCQLFREMRDARPWSWIMAGVNRTTPFYSRFTHTGRPEISFSSFLNRFFVSKKGAYKKTSSTYTLTLWCLSLCCMCVRVPSRAPQLYESDRATFLPLES